MRGTPFHFEGFVGGLNTIANAYEVASTESRECLNVVSTERGSIKKRNGSTLFNKSAETPNVELVSLATVNIGGTRYLIASGGKNLYSINTAGEVSTIGEAFTEGLQWSVFQANKGTEVTGGPVYLTNGTDKAQFWAGTEKATKVAEWKGLENAVERADGVLKEGKVTLTSATGGFVPSDIGLNISFVSAVKQKTAGTEIKTARIVSRPSSTEVVVEIDAAGWEKEYTTVKFKIERNYYPKAPGVPQGKYALFANERVWMTGIEGDTSAVRWSELVPIGEGGEQPDPTVWPKNNVVRFDPEDGKPITGLGTVGPYVLVFKANKTWIIHNAAPIATRKLSNNTGCVSHRSIVETPGGTYFLTADSGIYLTTGTHLTEMSYNVRPTILGINPAKREQACGAYFANHYYLSFASGTSSTNNRTLDYDTRLKSWWLHDLAGNQWAQFEGTTGEPMLFVTRPKTKDGVLKAFAAGVYQDNSENYAGNGVMGAYWLGAWEPFYFFIFRHRVKAPHVKKRVRAVFFNGEGQIIPGIYKNFSLAERQEPAVVGAEEIATKLSSPVEFGAGAAHWAEGEGVWGTGEGFWGGESPIGNARMYSLGVANVWSVGWGNNSKEPFTVDGYTLMAQFRKS